MANSFRSERLLYRAVEPDDEGLFLSYVQDPVANQNSNPELSRPRSKVDAQNLLKGVEEAMLGVVICLPAADNTSQPIPIGHVHLSPLSGKLAHHRFTEAHLGITKAYQGQGYGTEALSWALRWAFETAGMNRVGIQVLEWNQGARRMYERLGFKFEGVNRAMWWHNGRFWDNVNLAILNSEWEEMQKSEGAAA